MFDELSIFDKEKKLKKLLSTGAQDNNYSDLKNNIMSEITDFEPSRYEVFGDLFGRGGFCKVLKAWDKRKAKFIAIKLYRENDELLMREIRANVKLPKTVKYVVKLSKCSKRISHKKGPEEVLLVYEAGVCDLKDLRKQRFDFKAYYSEKELLQIIEDVSKGLLELQSVGITHGDIKESNIIYSRCPSKYMLIDLNSSGDENSKGMGETKYYANSNIDHRDYDIWCLGVTILNLINLELLQDFSIFKGDKKYAIIRFRNILSSSKNKFSKEFSTLLSGMLNLEEAFPTLDDVIKKQTEISEILASEKIIKVNIYRDKLTYNDEIYARKAEIYKIKKSIKKDGSGSNCDSFIKGYEKIFDYDICFLLSIHKLDSGLDNENLSNTIYDCARYSSLSASNMKDALELLDYHNETIFQGDLQYQSDILRYRGIINKHLFNFESAFDFLMQAIYKRLEFETFPVESKLKFLDNSFFNECFPKILEKIKENKKRSTFNKIILVKIIEDLRELGALLYELCMYKYAEKCYSCSYEIYKSFRGEKKDLMNLEYLMEIDGLSVDLKKNDLNEFNEKFEEIKKKYKNYNLKNDDISPKQAYNFLNIGQIFEMNTYFRSALDIYRIYKKILQGMRVNNYNPYYIKACLLKGNLLTNLFLFNLSLPEIKDALINCKSQKEKRSPLLAECYIALGNAYFKLGLPEKAGKKYEKAQGIYDKLLGLLPNKSASNQGLFGEKLGLLYLNFAELYLEQQNESNFEIFQEKAEDEIYKIMNQGFNSSNPSAAKIKLLSGKYYLQKMEIRASVSFLEEGLKILMNPDGKYSGAIEFAKLSFLLGICYYILGEKEKHFGQKKNLFSQSETHFSNSMKLLPEKHPDRVKAINLSDLLYREISVDLKNSISFSNLYASDVVKQGTILNIQPEFGKLLSLVSSCLEKLAGKKDENERNKIIEKINFFKDLLNSMNLSF